MTWRVGCVRERGRGRSRGVRLCARGVCNDAVSGSPNRLTRLQAVDDILTGIYNGTMAKHPKARQLVERRWGSACAIIMLKA